MATAAVPDTSYENRVTQLYLLRDMVDRLIAINEDAEAVYNDVVSSLGTPSNANYARAKLAGDAILDACGPQSFQAFNTSDEVVGTVSYITFGTTSLVNEISQLLNAHDHPISAPRIPWVYDVETIAVP